MPKEALAVVEESEIASRIQQALAGTRFSPADILAALTEVTACILAVHIRAGQSSTKQAVESVEWFAQETLKRLNQKVTH